MARVRVLSERRAICRLKDQADRAACFNRMFDKVSQGRATTFLLDHGCTPW